MFEKHEDKTGRPVSKTGRGIGVFIAVWMALCSAAWAHTTVTLAWDPSPDTNVTGYVLHYGSASGQYVTDIPAGAVTTMTVSNLTAGVPYYFVVTARDANGVESEPSNEATFEAPLDVPPAITSQPGSVTIADGSKATFSVAAAGDQPLEYQWVKNGSTILVDDGRISGANTSVLTLKNVSGADEAEYSVVVSNAAGSVTSSAASLNILNPPVITMQPASQSVNLGSSATFSVAASGSSPAYRWMKDGAVIPGATGSTLRLSAVSAGDAGGYSVVVSNSFGAVTSAIAELSLVNPPVITAQPLGVSTNAGARVVLGVAAEGQGPLLYQWVKNGTNNLSDAGTISGATSNVLVLTNVLGADRGVYTVKVSNQAGSVTSSAAVVDVVDPIITSQPANLSVAAGANAQFSVTAVGGSLQYQWYKDSSSVAGATNATLVLANVSNTSAGSYSVVVAGAYGSVASEAASLTVGIPAGIFKSPASVSGAVGSTVSFTVSATGPGRTYQWLKDGVVVAGAASSTLTLANITAASAGNYVVVVSNAAGSATSASAALTVISKPVIVSQPASKSAVSGATVHFAVGAMGDELSYSWQKGGQEIQGATGSSLMLEGVNESEAGNYSVVVSNVAGAVSSSVAVLQVVAPEPDPVASAPLTPPSLVLVPAAQPGGPVSIKFPVTAGVVYELEASSDLQNWTTIKHMDAAADSSEAVVADPDSVSIPQRFYRLAMHQ